ncbi:MAG: hypothetical protein AAGN35_11175 [Bacteroidota bacterium]
MMYENVLPVIEDFVIGFQRDPEFYSEDTDIRRDLYSAIYRHFSQSGVQFNLPQRDLAIGYYPERGQITLTPVKTAYPIKEKFDIAVLDPEAPRPLSITETMGPERYQRYWEQPVAVAVQIHLCKEEQSPEKYFRKLKSDLKKFAAYDSGTEFTGLSLLLVQGSVSELAAAYLPDAPGSYARVVTEDGLFAWTPPIN